MLLEPARFADAVMVFIGVVVLVWCIAVLSKMTARTSHKRRVAFVLMSLGAFMTLLSGLTGMHHEIASIGTGFGVLALLWSGVRDRKDPPQGEDGNASAA